MPLENLLNGTRNFWSHFRLESLKVDTDLTVCGDIISANGIRPEEIQPGNENEVLTTIDTPDGLQSSWQPVVQSGNIYSEDGALTEDRQVNIDEHDLVFRADTVDMTIKNTGIAMSAEVGSFGIESTFSCANSVTTRSTHPVFGTAEVRVASNASTLVPGNDPGGVFIEGNNMWIPELTEDNTLTEVVMRGPGGALQKMAVSAITNQMSAWTDDVTRDAQTVLPIVINDELVNQMGVVNAASVFSGLAGTVEIVFTCSAMDMAAGNSITIALQDGGVTVASTERTVTSSTGDTNYQIYLTTVITDPASIQARVTAVTGTVRIRNPCIKFYQR